MQPIFTASCAEGRLTITERSITIERRGLQSSSMPRMAYTGLETKMLYWIPLPGMTRYRLTFRGQGAERLKASAVTKKTVRSVRAILGG